MDMDDIWDERRPPDGGDDDSADFHTLQVSKKVNCLAIFQKKIQ